MRSRRIFATVILIAFSLVTLSSCVTQQESKQVDSKVNYPPDYTYNEYIENNRLNSKEIIKVIEESNKSTAGEAVDYFKKNKDKLNLKMTFVEAVYLIPEIYLKDHNIDFKRDKYGEISLDDNQNKDEIIKELRAFMDKNYPNLKEAKEYFKTLTGNLSNETKIKEYKDLGVIYKYKDGKNIFFDPLGIIKVE